MGRRTLLLIAAVLLAAIGTGALFFYIQATAQPVSGGTGTTDSVAVLVPTAAVDAGIPITAALEASFTTVQVPKSLASRGAYVTSFAQIRGKVTNRRLEALAPVLLAYLGGVVQARGVPFTIPAGQMALTVQLDDPNRVSTFLAGGSLIAVWVTVRTGGEVRLVLSPVTVLTIGTQETVVTPGASPTGAAGRGSQQLVTLAVTQDQAGTILQAQQSGTLYFTLLGPRTTATPTTYPSAVLDVPGSR